MWMIRHGSREHSDSLEPWGISHIEGDVTQNEPEQGCHVYICLFCVHDTWLSQLCFQ